MKLILFVMSVMIILGGYQIKCCLQNERAGLLQIMSYFPSNSHPEFVYSYPSWPVGDEKSDCCEWERVMCNPSTGHVTHLFLNSMVRSNFSYGIYVWDLNMSVFLHFQELRTLDLSRNGIGSLVQGEGLGMLKNLQHLNLSFNQLSANLEDFLWNLSSLRVLDLSACYLIRGELDARLCRLREIRELYLAHNSLNGSLPACVWNWTSLQVLDLMGNSISGNLPSSINLPSLEWLSIANNNFRGKFSLSSLSNHSSLKILLLSNNALQVDMEESLSIQLQILGLANCNLSIHTKILHKSLSYQSSLQYVDLSSNSLVGSFPTWLLQNNSNLRFLNLGDNSLTGSLQPPTHMNSSLRFLDISSNQLSGEIPHHIGMALSALRILSMNNNLFQGQIPSSFCNITQLLFLTLQNNKVWGQVPKDLLSGSSLQLLGLSYNSLDGEIIPSYMNMSSLEVLGLDNNHFVGTIKESLKISTLLMYLDVSTNEATGEFPSWIGSFSQLKSLSLAKNQFHGSIPSQIFNLQALEYLDLSENRFTGQIPSCGLSSYLGFLSLHGNSLSGPIPMGLQRCSFLRVLDLASNQLSGDVPRWIHVFSNLKILLLGYNQLQGELPIQLCQLQNLDIIDLSNNRISGAIPSCFQNLSFGALPRFSKLDDAGQIILTYYLSFLQLKNHSIFREPFAATASRREGARFNVKSRFDIYMGYILRNMSVLDLSCNQFTGGIPPELGELTALNTLNFSHNHLSGPIPESFSKLKSVESLDLSSNKLSGTIPWQLVDLNFLEVFNVSYNNLSGEVPDTRQFGSFDESSYRGNPLLCGSHLPKSCTVMEPPPDPSTEWGDEGDTAFDWQVFFWSFGVSSIIVLFTFLAVFYINPYWSRAWFSFIDRHLLWRLY